MSTTAPELAYALTFYGFAALAVVAALVVISARSFVISAIWLVVSLIAVAGIYVLLKAPFLAMVQVLVYAGAIMVLFVMLIMLMDVKQFSPGARGQNLLRGAAAVTGALIMLAFATVYSQTGSKMRAQWAAYDAVEPGTVERIGGMLFTKYLLPFEVLSLLLVAAVVAALYLARRPEEKA